MSLAAALTVIGAICSILTLIVLGVALCVSASDTIPGVNEPRNPKKNRP